MRGPKTINEVSAVCAAIVVAIVSLPQIALAQAPPEITPNFSVTPTRTVAPWIYQMAVGAVVVAALILVFILASYLRFSPKFFGRETTKPVPPGVRPPLLQRAPRPPQVEATAPVPAPAARAPAARAPAEPAATARAAPATATAVAERPASAAAPAATEGTATAAAASAAPTAPPQSEAAAQADAAGQAEAAAPDPAPQRAAVSHGEAALDQETFDRVLQEQLDKGMDRRVAEGRARAAAVVAARKKAQR